MPGPFHLYLVRHAVAEERGADWPDDSQRPLTAEGSKRWRREAHGLAALGARPDLILTSPFTRARQTADLLAAAFPKKPKAPWPAHGVLAFATAKPGWVPYSLPSPELPATPIAGMASAQVHAAARTSLFTGSPFRRARLPCLPSLLGGQPPDVIPRTGEV